MKLTIIRLTGLTTQDKIDLNKIWPEYESSSLMLSQHKHIYAAKFNDHLLGAARVTLDNTQGVIDSLRIREITRRRGVGQYLVEEIIRNNLTVTNWSMANTNIEDPIVMASFMKALKFQARDGGWEKITQSR